MSNYGWTLWLVIGGMALGTIFNRAALIVLAGRVTLPPAVQASLRYAPAAALAAIVVPELFVHNGQIDLSLDNVKLLAGLAGFIIAMRSQHTIVAIACGMLALHALEMVLVN